MFSNRDTVVDKRVKMVGILATLLVVGAVVAVVMTHDSAPVGLSERAEAASPAFMAQLEEDSDAHASERASLSGRDLEALAQEHLSQHDLHGAKSEEEARSILKRHLSKMGEDEDLLENLVSEWKLSQSKVAGDSQSGYLYNRNSGPLGGNGGQPFTFEKSNKLITMICVRSGALIDAIKVRYSDGTWSAQKGGNGGQFHCFRPSGECISSVFVKTGALVDGLLVADKDGSISPYYGGYGGRGTAISNDRNRCLYKIELRYGRYIDQMKFSFRSADVPLAAFYRYWNAPAGDHFYTTNAGEIGTTRAGVVGRFGYRSEGIACFISKTRQRGLVPLYRYWQPHSRDHFYTTHAGEIGTTIAGRVGRYGYKSEGIAGYCSPRALTGSVPFFRYWNPHNTDHFYTTNWAELGAGRHGWGLEGIQCYVWKTSSFRLPYAVESAVEGKELKEAKFEFDDGEEN